MQSILSGRGRLKRRLISVSIYIFTYTMMRWCCSKSVRWALLIRHVWRRWRSALMHFQPPLLFTIHNYWLTVVGDNMRSGLFRPDWNAVL